MKIKCRTISRGVAEGEVLLTNDAISFLGNVEPETGEVVEPQHQLYGQSIAGKVLVFPHGKGSTVGSYVIYQLFKNGVAPAAMINLESEPIVAVGAIISEVPLVDRLEKDPYKILKNGDMVVVNSTEAFVELRNE
ncbi:predicted aconitase subunit 2 [Methanolobus vulcani]|uniref:Phosphomevalonate dehydratase small subunit n=2 Tax=Methanolobus vulcani TaxID=38026 RepID=A0A7Z7AVN7_9EURY|nr:predicted aconitase subunit 2 [Methanolobus vulcani]